MPAHCFVKNICGLDRACRYRINGQKFVIAMFAIYLCDLVQEV